MDAPEKKKSAESPIHREYCHPLKLQKLSPGKFTAMVNKILNGKLKLLIQKIDRDR